MNERGFTLAELLVACAVVGVVLAGVFVLQQQGQLAYVWGAARVETQQNARLALDLLTRELRSAQSITSCAATSIGFTDANGTPMTYARAGGSAPFTLQRTDNGTTSDVIGGVQAFTVTCFTSDGYTTTTTAASVRSVLVQLQTRVAENVSATSPAGQRATVESRVKLRNL
jgi:type IV pilus assembly protein PilW